MRSRAIKTIAVILLILAVVFAGAYAGFRHALLEGAPWAVDLAIARAGRALVGQRITDTAVEVELLPSKQRLQARATLVVCSEHGPRRAFTFLLNPGLEVTRATVAGQDASRVVLATLSGQAAALCEYRAGRLNPTRIFHLDQET